MMGERTVMQEALFYEFSINRHVPAGDYCALSPASSTCPACGPICGPSIARSGGPRSIRS